MWLEGRVKGRVRIRVWVRVRAAVVAGKVHRCRGRGGERRIEAALAREVMVLPVVLGELVGVLAQRREPGEGEGEGEG